MDPNIFLAVDIMHNMHPFIFFFSYPNAINFFSSYPNVIHLHSAKRDKQETYGNLIRAEKLLLP